MAIQVLGTRAVGEGAARASGACELNKLVPMIRHLVRCSYCVVPFNQLVTFFRHRPKLGLCRSLGVAGGTKQFTWQGERERERVVTKEPRGAPAGFRHEPCS